MSKKYQITRFTKLASAKGYSSCTIKASAVMLGDDGYFWVVNLATMERMLRDGYELA